MTRERLPARRASKTLDLLHVTPGGQEFVYRATVSYYADGRVGEVFLNSKKPTSAHDIAASDAAITLSIAIQHGVDLETLRHAMSRGEDGRPHGLLGTLLDAMADLPPAPVLIDAGEGEAGFSCAASAAIPSAEDGE